jgi:diguanylate cyclase (GGDEF)-like protein
MVAVALALRMALLTRRAGQFGRAQAGRVAELTRRALHDPLTGLPNRTLLEDRLAMALAGQRRTGSVLGVLFCDLDHFKVVNDSYGHDTGDDVLVTMAQRLTHAVRATDTVSRLGGDEFVVLCPDLAGQNELTEVVERIVALLSVPMEIGGRELTVSGSVAGRPPAGSRCRHVPGQGQGPQPLGAPRTGVGRAPAAVPGRAQRHRVALVREG